MNHYEAKQEARRERLEARADRLRREADAAFKRADMSEEATGIPFGQPVLVGHHSEGHHRAAIARADRAMRKSIDLSKAANEAAGRAASVGYGGISSDDPDAIAKLKAELADAEKRQELMKDCNSIIRRHKSTGALPHLIQRGLNEKVAASLLQCDVVHGLGFASYQITNNGANIRRIKARIEQLQAMAKRETVEKEASNGLRIVENAEANRLQLFFPGKPDDATRAELKSRGFRWAPSEGAWQAYLTNRAKWHVGSIVKVWEAGQ